MNAAFPASFSRVASLARGSDEAFENVNETFAAPAAAGDGNYTLQLAGFPPEQLGDESRAVGDGLAGAVIIQR